MQSVSLTAGVLKPNTLSRINCRDAAGCFRGNHPQMTAARASTGIYQFAKMQKMLSLETPGAKEIPLPKKHIYTNNIVSVLDQDQSQTSATQATACKKFVQQLNTCLSSAWLACSNMTLQSHIIVFTTDHGSVTFNSGSDLTGPGATMATY